MALLGLINQRIEIPFYGAKWNTNTGKIIASTSQWAKLSPDTQLEILTMAPWDFFHYQDHHFFKYVFPEDSPPTQTFLLLPADEWYNTLQKLDKIQNEYQNTREQLLGFVQNTPVPLLVVTNDNTQKVLFANQLLLDFFTLPLAKLYSGISLHDLFKVQTPYIQQLIQNLIAEKKAIQEVIELNTLEQDKRFILIRLFLFKTSFMEGIIISFIDLTKEKEQENRLQEAYNELQAQAEELAQAHDSLSLLHNELTKQNQLVQAQKKELEESLKSAYRYQRKILLNKQTLTSVRHYYEVYGEFFLQSFVGGDFNLVIDEHPILKDWIFLVVGDATGHGPSGAMLALTTSLLLKTAIIHLSDLESLHSVFLSTHAQLYDILDVKEQLASTEGAEVTLLALPKNIKLYPYAYCSLAGSHMFILHQMQKTFSIIAHDTKAIGWYLKDVHLKPYSTQKLPLSPKDTFVLHSDGILDQFNPEKRKLGKKRWKSLLAQAAGFSTLQEQYDFLITQWKEWKMDAPQTDDAILLTIKPLEA